MPNRFIYILEHCFLVKLIHPGKIIIKVKVELKSNLQRKIFKK